jgi:uncharacterized Zn finger protein
VKYYTDELVKCNSCGKARHFLIKVVEKEKQFYYLTECPACSAHDEVSEITAKEARVLLSHASTKDD